MVDLLLLTFSLAVSNTALTVGDALYHVLRIKLERKKVALEEKKVELRLLEAKRNGDLP